MCSTPPLCDLIEAMVMIFTQNYLASTINRKPQQRFLGGFITMVIERQGEKQYEWNRQGTCSNWCA
jgi:hypothetical protein